MGKNSRAIGLLIILILVFASACDEKNPVPKPSCYLRTDFPPHSYSSYNVKNALLSYAFDISDLFSLRQNVAEKKYGFQEFDLGPLNGTLLIYSKRFESKDSLIKLINAANDLVDEHKIKADGIDFNQLIDGKKKVYGTFFTLKGNVATNYQFYLTDSMSKFVRGEILLNCRPNYDSLRPTLDYLRIDLNRMMESFQWKN